MKNMIKILCFVPFLSIFIPFQFVICVMFGNNVIDVDRLKVSSDMPALDIESIFRFQMLGVEEVINKLQP